MSNNLKRAIKYNRVKGYWYLEGSNHSEYRQLQNGERLTTRGTVQYFSNGTKKYLPNWTVAIMDLVPNFLAGQDVRSKVGNIKLQTGDIVDIYMPFSPSSKRAANEGRFQNRTSTHTIIGKTKSTIWKNEKYIFADFRLFVSRLFDSCLIAA